MKTDRDMLDEAIDRVAQRLTHVDDDAQFASRVIASLPERSTWFGWLTHSWVAGLAMIAIIVSAVTVWNARQMTEVAPALQPIAGVQPIQPQAPFAVALDPARLAVIEPVATSAQDSSAPIAVLQARLDHERSLPPVTAPKALDVVALPSESLAAESALTLDALVIADLPLTAESFPQRD